MTLTQWQKITLWVLFAATVLLLGYDVIAYLKGGIEATISWIVFTEGQYYEAIPFFLGFLMGHLFGQMKPK